LTPQPFATASGASVDSQSVFDRSDRMPRGHRDTDPAPRAKGRCAVASFAPIRQARGRSVGLKRTAAKLE
jgi:hypothetical protein